MRMLILISVSWALSAYQIGLGQSPTPLDFFPHHQGDVFEYQNAGLDSWFQNIIVRDSLGDGGRYYLETTYFGNFSIDTVSYEVCNRQYGGEEYSTLLFKLDADSGDSWICWRNQVGAIKATVTRVFASSGFGEEVVAKDIAYSDSASGLFMRVFRIASRFGIIAEYQDPVLTFYLRGARINGVTYGTVTGINENNPAYIPKHFALHQNYPNPFNSTTLITFELEREMDIRLDVYNVLGQHVCRLISGQTSKGTHTARFESNNLPGGMLFYRLSTIDGSAVKRMLLIK